MKEPKTIKPSRPHGVAVKRLVSQEPHVAQNGNAVHFEEAKTSGFPGESKTHKADAYAGTQITPLLPLLGSTWCDSVKKSVRRHLAKTDLQFQQWEALFDLWKSLGCPETGFWPALLVDYNRIDAFSCDSANVES